MLSRAPGAREAATSSGRLAGRPRLPISMPGVEAKSCTGSSSPSVSNCALGSSVGAMVSGPGAPMPSR
jgi:hypothetical protein